MYNTFFHFSFCCSCLSSPPPHSNLIQQIPGTLGNCLLCLFTKSALWALLYLSLIKILTFQAISNPQCQCFDFYHCVHKFIFGVCNRIFITGTCSNKFTKKTYLFVKSISNFNNKYIPLYFMDKLNVLLFSTV